MNPHPVERLAPIFRWLDYWVISAYGLYIYLVMVWLSPFVIAWILSGGFWRRPPRRRWIVEAPPVIIIHFNGSPPPLPPGLPRVHKPPLADESQSFAV
jgi:hypothetical protein